jgi:hypothetical protein
MERIIVTVLLLLVSITFTLSTSLSTSRTVTFVNQCGDDYFIAPTSAAAPFVAGVSACNSNADCETGSSCLLANHFCYYDVPTPTSGSFSVLAGQTNEIVFPFYNNGDSSHWCGNFGFCGGDMPCTQNEDVCNQDGCGVDLGPYNVAEINFLKTGDDYYDISNINGFNVPMSITPSVTSSSIFMPSNPYQCGAPGSPTPLTGLGISSWEPVPPSPYYQWVVPSSQVCLSDSDCSNGDSCGLTNVIGRVPQFELTCGQLIGYWTADQACGLDPTNLLQGAGPFGCTTPVLNGAIATTLGSMQGCGGTSGSGYSDNADSSSCGCQDWYKIFGADVVPLETGNCTASNPLWMAEILPTLTWVKEICPSCYVYPYDDKSSTFTCYLEENGYNVMNYTVTLCPSSPAVASVPTKAPTSVPTKAPTSVPKATVAPKATAAPTKSVTVATSAPTKAPTSAPSKTQTAVGAETGESQPAAETGAETSACANFGCASTTSCCDDVTLGPTCYYTTQHSCLTGSEGTVLCATGDGVCGTVCYNAATYQCCNNEITLSTATCASTPVARSLLSLDTDDVTTAEFSSSSRIQNVFYWTPFFFFFCLL